MANEKKITATVPGNLLICGEYIVLEEDGLGIAVATGPSATALARRSPEASSAIHVITDEGMISLNCAMKIAGPPFIIKAHSSILRNLRQRGYDPPSLEIEINSAQFFRKGRKLGLGASAAATLLLAGLMFAWAMKDNELSREVIANAALEAHRHAQGKRGSGYDIFTSCYGSAGIFTGGDRPQWDLLNEDHPLFSTRAYTFPGPQEVNTRQAVKRYQDWREHAGEGDGDFFARSQELVRGLHSDRDEEQFLRRITELRLLSTELGEHIGVESWISPPTPFYERSAWKGSGAGNELGLLFLSGNSSSHLPGTYRKININREGLRLFSDNGSVILD